jgi:hypothetical protein
MLLSKRVAGALPVAAWAVCLWATVVIAQVNIWKLGGDGLDWAAQDTVEVLIDFEAAPGAIQPLYLTPDQSVISLRQGWSTLREPNLLGEIGFINEERPRIWKWDDGRINPTESGILLVDADSSTYSTAIADRIDFQFLTFDLSVAVPAQRFGFYTPPAGFRADGKPLADDFVPAYRISVQEQPSAVFATPGPNTLETLIAEDRENLDAQISIEFPRQYVRYVRYTPLLTLVDEEAQAKTGNVSVALRGTVADFELFAHGVPQRTLYKSKIIDLDSEQNFGRLFFKATPMRMIDGEAVEVPEAQASVKIEVRTGRDSDPNVYHEFIVTGQEKIVSFTEFAELKPQKTKRCTTCEFVFRTPRPGIRGSVGYDTDNWTFWSTSFTESGQPLRLRSGSHIQLQVTFESESFDDFIRLDSLWIERAPLLASQVLGEVSRLDEPQPARGFAEVELGQMTDFSYELSATFAGSGLAGFDALRIRTGSSPSFKSLEIDGTEVEPAEVVAEDDALFVRLPQRVTSANSRPMRVVFATEVFDLATSFEAEIIDLEQETLVQPVVAGDVNPAVGTNSLRVLSVSGKQTESLRDVRLSAGVLTPNGDGTNDELVVSYALFGLPERVPVALEAYSLDGRLVARRVETSQGSGEQQLRWDGRDDNGRILAPGMYLVRIEVQADASGAAKVQPLGIAY